MSKTEESLSAMWLRGTGFLDDYWKNRMRVDDTFAESNPAIVEKPGMPHHGDGEDGVLIMICGP